MVTYYFQQQRWMYLNILVIAFAFLLTTCRIPPTPDSFSCAEEIKNPTTLQNLIMNNPTIQEINKELTLADFSLSSCLNNDTVQVYLDFDLPKNFSDYSIPYSSKLILIYFMDGTITTWSDRPNVSFDKDSIISSIKEEIQRFESNSRVAEFLSNIEVPPGNLPLHFEFGNVEIYADSARIAYNGSQDRVVGYLLPNTINWTAFPEIAEAHHIIEEKLLIGGLERCAIGRGDKHSYTSAQNSADTDSWHMTVALICEDGWKDADVQLNPNGTYERLEISREYNK